MSAPLTQHVTNSSHDRDFSEKALEAQIEQEPAKERYVAPAQGGFLHKTKRHCARWWWVHLIIFCIVFLIVALCLVYVGMPKIAQHGVDESSIEITDLEFLDPTPEYITLTQKAILHSPSMYTPTLDPFSAGSYLVTNGTYSSEPMIFIEMPRIHALHPKSNASVEGQVVHINNLEAVTNYCIAVLTQEEVTSALVGKTKLHEGKLPVVTINYNTTTTYKGLNGLKGFNVTDVTLNLTAKAGAPNLFGNAFVPNPSLITFAMGNVTLNLSTAKHGIVGNSTILDMTLRPGDNNLPMTAIIDQAKVTDSMNADTGIVELFIVGNSSVYNGQHLTYYEQALSSNKLTLEMNVKQILADTLAASKGS